MADINIEFALESHLRTQDLLHFMLNWPGSIRVQLLFSFLLLNLVVATGVIISYGFYRRLEVLDEYEEDIHLFNQLLAAQMQREFEFMMYDSKNPSNYQLAQFPALSPLHELRFQIDSLEPLLRSPIGGLRMQKVEGQLKRLFDLKNHHDTLFDSIAFIVKHKGLKNWGLIGVMRVYAHDLEASLDRISLAQLLQLRRHEKDFLLRDEWRYVEKHQLLGKSIMRQIHSPSLDSNYEQIALKRYLQAFTQVADLQRQLGNFYSEGLYKQMHDSERYLSQTFQEIVSTLGSEKVRITKLITHYILLILIFTFIISIILSIYLSKTRSRPLKALVSQVKRVPIKGIEALRHSPPSGSKEIRDLHQAFKSVVQQLDQQLMDNQNTQESLRKQNQELAKVNKELDQFVYSISHDLRAPLSSVLGLLELTKLNPTPTEISEYLEMMEKSLLKLDDFIQDILHFSRNARTHVEQDTIHVQSLIDEILTHLNYMPGKSQISVTINIDEKIPLCSDKRRLKMVFNNLLSNAIKYHDEQKAKQSIHIIGRVDQEGLQVRITDNGIGIAPEKLDHIFEMFYRATGLSKGSGLGLYIAKETVQTLGGSIEVQSELNCGSTFTLFIPHISV